MIDTKVPLEVGLVRRCHSVSQAEPRFADPYHSMVKIFKMISHNSTDKKY